MELILELILSRGSPICRRVSFIMDAAELHIPLYDEFPADGSCLLEINESWCGHCEQRVARNNTKFEESWNYSVLAAAGSFAPFPSNIAWIQS